jgi:hypothetical protein
MIKTLPGQLRAQRRVAHFGRLGHGFRDLQLSQTLPHGRPVAVPM